MRGRQEQGQIQVSVSVRTKHVSLDLMFDLGPGPAQGGAETAPGQDLVPSLGLALGEAPGIALDPDPGLKPCSYYDAK